MADKTVEDMLTDICDGMTANELVACTGLPITRCIIIMAKVRELLK